MIRLENIGLQFGHKRIFDGLTALIPDGAKVAVKGESGSGKSSLLRILLGFEPAATGKVYYDDMLLTPATVGRIRSRTAYVPQDLGFTVFRSTRELFYTPFRFKNNRRLMPAPDKVDELFQQFGLPADILERGIKAISGGQKQRLLLAQAVLLGKPVLLLDEPTSALDEANRIKITEYILHLPVTVIAATHDDYWLRQSGTIIDLDKLTQTAQL